MSCYRERVFAENKLLKRWSCLRGRAAAKLDPISVEADELFKVTSCRGVRVVAAFDLVLVQVGELLK